MQEQAETVSIAATRRRKKYPLLYSLLPETSTVSSLLIVRLLFLCTPLPEVVSNLMTPYELSSAHGGRTRAEETKDQEQPPVGWPCADTVGGKAADIEQPPERLALSVLARNNAVMPGRSHNPITKPVVVLRKRTRPKSAVPPSAATPAVANLPPQATSTRDPLTPPSPLGSSPPITPPPPKGKPPPLPEDPAVIAARRAERIARIQGVLTELMTRWPQTFSRHPVPVRPLATGIGKEIAAQLPEVSKTLVHQAIAFWQRQRQTAYLQALITGGPRYDLAGNPQSAVTPEQQQRAQDKLVAWRAYRQEQQRTASHRSRPTTAREGRDKGNAQDVPRAAD